MKRNNRPFGGHLSNRGSLLLMGLFFALVVPLAASAATVTLSFNPWSIIRGSNSVLTAVASGGTEPYTYQYQTRLAAATNWSASGMTGATNIFAWPESRQYRVRVVDASKATSAWSAAASLLVKQPKVTLTANPPVVTQSQSSVISAVTTNATQPVLYQWQYNTTTNPVTGWVTLVGTWSALTNVWPSTRYFRARGVDANRVTSDWSEVTGLTVMPSAIEASLAFNPTNVLRGETITMTASATKGTAPYRYSYEYRWYGTGTWRSASITSAVNAYAWAYDLEYRVRVVDSFNATSDWASAFVTVKQPEVTVSFTPAVVTQSQSAVVSAVATNVNEPLLYQWQQNTGSGWTTLDGIGAMITNVWPSTVDVRARSVDANSVTSEWSAAATLTVMPSIISATLAFNPTNTIRGTVITMTAAATNGTLPYRYNYQYRWGGEGDWRAAGITSAVNAYAWYSNLEYRVRAIDALNSTSDWATAFVTVRQPAVTVSFVPEVVTQSQSAVVSAAVTDATLPVTYQWQKNTGSGWSNAPESGAAITNIWPATVSYRARSVDANNVTSDWSSAAMLTVMPSVVAATLEFSPTNTVRGVTITMTAAGTNGMAPYQYRYEYRWGGEGTWRSASITAATNSYAWYSNLEYRVRVTDSFNATSDWTTAFVTVRQPGVEVSFSPSVVTQSQPSVVRAVVSNATLPLLSYHWQADSGAGWYVPDWEGPSFTNVWPVTLNVRARSVDANGVISEWSPTATLTVMPSILSASLSFNPSAVWRGSNSVLTVVPTNGTAPYAYQYEYRYDGGSWTAATRMTSAITTNAWPSNVEVRVRIVDSFSSTSDWASASLPVAQPIVTASLSPSVLTQSQSSVLSAVVTNAALPVTYSWQQNAGSGWSNMAATGPSMTNVWPTTRDFRARVVTADSVTSEWSEATTLTVMPSILSVSLSFSPTNLWRGSNSVMTAVATNGTAPYVYTFQHRYDPVGTWITSEVVTAVTTNAWPSNIQYRVRIVDSFSSTSAWTSASLTVQQPRVNVALSPSVLTQSQSSVLSATVSNASLPVTYTWQQNAGGGWSNMAATGPSMTNVWPTTRDFRARTLDANNVTSDWSAVATLTVMPSILSATLTFSPATVWRGSNSVLTAVPTNGTAPYAFQYEYRYDAGDWQPAAGMTEAVTTNFWTNSVDYRVRIVDNFNSTSGWTTASLTVQQPSATVTLNPAVVTQSWSSVASATVSNATLPVTFSWQEDAGEGWTDLPDNTSSITNIWPTTRDFRARSVDANSVTSEWSSAATLTVMPSIISATLAFNPTNRVRGTTSVLTAVPTNGMAPYTYSYEYRYDGGEWTPDEALTGPITTNFSPTNVEYRARVTDSFSSTSAWASAYLTVRQPGVAVTFNPTVVTQSHFSTASATVSNATLPVTYDWQQNFGGAGWSNVTGSGSAISNAWAATGSVRARSIDANRVTSEWSSATLTVMPSIVSATLAFSPTNIMRGTNAVLTAAATNGTPPYAYYYEYRYTTSGAWSAAGELTGPVNTNAFPTNAEYRVRAVDFFASTTAWATASLTVRQPEVTVTFTPPVVTQSWASVVSAAVVNAWAPVTFEWQQDGGGGWSNMAGSGAKLTNIWPQTVEVRARSLDSRGVTSAWASATLTVMPSIMTATLAFNPTNLWRGSNSVLTASATNGMAPYAYSYEYRYDGGTWTPAVGMTERVTTNGWTTNVEYRVRSIDSFSSTSAWASAYLTVRQPEVTVALSRSVVTQSQSCVASATVVYASGAVTYEWQEDGGGGWSNLVGSGRAITNFWPATVDLRARSIDVRSVTSDWSAAETLTVMPSIMSATLAFAPTNVMRGTNAVLTANATNGMAPYTYFYEYRYDAGDWIEASGMSDRVTTNFWTNSVEYRVRSVDSFSSTSAWTEASLTVRQPEVTVTFLPSVVTQSWASIASAAVVNAWAPITYEWQEDGGGGWSNLPWTSLKFTNIWPASVSVRARSTDARSVTSEWSTASLTVMPSIVSATLAFNPTNLWRGSNSVLTANATNGMAPYAYMYEYRYDGGDWVEAVGMTDRVTTNLWTNSVEYRVRTVDSFNSTSGWTAASLTVRQPEVTVALSASVITQSQPCVVSAAVVYASAPVSYEWQEDGGGGWSNLAFTIIKFTNIWPATVDIRARSIDGRSVTSEWSAAQTLTVMPSIMSATLAFAPTNVMRGTNAVLTANATNGMAPYTYLYEYRYDAGDWVEAVGMTDRVTTNAWTNSVEYRVRSVDSFSSTSGWTAASLTVRQPDVTVTFTPSVVTQSWPSVVSAAVVNAWAPITYEWQEDGGGGWSNLVGSGAKLTNIWPKNVDVRARSTDARGVTSEWSSAATLTVMPSIMSATLAFAPTNVMRGTNAVLTANATNGMAPYTYSYEYRYDGGDWIEAVGMSDRVTTNAWTNSVEYRVRSIDSFSSTSAWTAASLTIRQPAVTVTFSPSVVTQSRPSVVSASITNAWAPITYEWQEDGGGGWSNLVGSGQALTNIWPKDVDVRARSMDARGVTSEWSSAATLTVMPSIISSTLSFSPTNLWRGSNSVLTANATNGMAPYAYSYEYRYDGGDWVQAAGMTDRVTTNAWPSNVECRVRAIDSFNATSAWATASLTVKQPLVTVSFSPTAVTQSHPSVVSAVVTNASRPVTYEWQQNGGGGGWSNLVGNGPSVTNIWPVTVDVRARSLDVNNVTSEWSSAATLTVLPSIISATLSFSPTNVWKGSNSVLTAVATNGMAPYSYAYEVRYGSGDWVAMPGMTGPITTNAWPETTECRVQVTDSFGSVAWASAIMTVVQPEVTVTMSPSVITQSQSSVAGAAVAYAALPVTYEWEQDGGGGWSNIAWNGPSMTNVWPTTRDFRARSTDANGVTSAWSTASTLTVMPSILSATLAFNPTEVWRGSNSVLTAVGTNGTAPYTYSYEYRYDTGDWVPAEGMTAPMTTNAWTNSVEYRVRVADVFTSTSGWTTASLTVRQPEATVSLSRSVITQSQSCVLSAAPMYAWLPVTYAWQQDTGSGWTDMVETAQAITNVWPTTRDFRARIVTANNLTSEWSSAKTLIVMPSIISATLSFSPTNLWRGSNSVLTATVTNGTAPYAYSYEYRYDGGSWLPDAGLTTAVNTNAWPSNVQYRVRVVDTFSATSAWTTASLAVAQPLVTVTPTPSVITQSQSSVLSAAAANASLPATYEWQQDGGGGWSNIAWTGPSMTNVWPSTRDFRARSMDANNVTSEWSAASTLTVMPSIISATLSFSPTNLWRGSNSVLTAVATNGTAPYSYLFEHRYDPLGAWITSEVVTPITTNAWPSNVQYRVRVVDSFNATSSWTTASLTVVQPVATVTLSPSVITQSQPSVASVVVSNASLPVTFSWQQNTGSGWTDMPETDPAITNVWPSTRDFRARSVDANNVTSEWSSAKTLTVMPSIISATLSFSPTNVWRGSNSVMTAAATNGTAPYEFMYQYRYGTNSWVDEPGLEEVTTNAWPSNVQYRVRTVDSFSSTSFWTYASLTVVQPLVTVTITPSSLPQSQPSVAAATVNYAVPPVTFSWQQNTGSGWTDLPQTDPSITNVWPTTTDLRARIVSANGVTSEWSAAETLTVLPSEISASLAFNPTTVIRGSNITLTASATNGTAPYRYSYEFRWGGEGSWNAASITSAVNSFAWHTNLEYRVRTIDSFNATSDWATASVTVLQPRVTTVFTPSEVTQSVASVVSATVTNAALPVTYQWQQNTGSGWTDVGDTAAAITNVWPTTRDYRARSIDANSVTSDWSAATTLTVLPSAISATLAFSPTNVLRGELITMTASATNGTVPYRYSYEYRWNAEGSWIAASITSAVNAYAWHSNLEYRVRAIDSFNSTSEWATAFVTVRQPAMTVTFTPSVVTQSQSSVVSAVVTNATLPVTYEWQQDGGGGWSNVVDTAPAITNVWPATISYRARSIDANSVTSAWGSATLTVMPSAISASLSFTPASIIRGSNATITAVATNGTAPYAYQYEFRWGGTGTWSSSSLAVAETNFAWHTSVEYRVRVTDSFNATSAWASATLTVRQPEVSLTFAPTQVVHGISSVLRAAVSNAIPPYTLQFETRLTGEVAWTSSSITDAVTTNEWLSSVEFRARVVNANSVTSEWSATAALIVLDPAVSITLAISTNEVAFGNPVVVTSTPSGGTGPYVYEYQSKDISTPDNDWITETNLTRAVETNFWFNDVMIRVRIRDSATTNLSFWSTPVTLTVLPPEEGGADMLTLSIAYKAATASPQSLSRLPGAGQQVTLVWNGKSGNVYDILWAESLTSEWQVCPSVPSMTGVDGAMSAVVELDGQVSAMYFRIRQRNIVPAGRAKPAR